MATEIITWLPWIRHTERSASHWECLRKYEFGDQLDCQQWLYENYPPVVHKDTETLALPRGERPTPR